MKTSDLKESNVLKVRLSYAYLYEQIEALAIVAEKVGRAVCSKDVCGKDFTDAQARTLTRRIELAKANTINLKNEIESLLTASGVAK